MAAFYQDAVNQIGRTESVLHSLYKKIGRKDHIPLSEELVEKCGNKKELASFLLKVVNCSLDCIKVLKSGCLEVDALKSEAKCAIKDLAEVQSELLQTKREQIELFQNGVQATIKTELKSYSDAVKKSSGESVTLKNIKTAVKEIVEDRSRNIMIFGLKETDKENIDYKVSEVFQELDEKPVFRAERIGRKANENTDRPIKVSMESSVTVSNLLRKSKGLKSSPLSQVYLKPDRTLEQRLKHREIVQELKKCIQNSPEKHHFIKNGEICHQEKPKEKSVNNTESGSIDSEATRERKNPEKYSYRITLRQTEDHQLVIFHQSPQTHQIVSDGLKMVITL